MAPPRSCCRVPARPGARARLSGARDSWRAPTSGPTRRAPRPTLTWRCSPQPDPPPRPARPRPDAAGGRRSARRRRRVPSSSAGRSRRPSAAASGRGHRAWSARSRPSARARRCAAAPSARARRPGRAANAGLAPGRVGSSCGTVRARAERGGGAGAGGGARAGGEARAGRGAAAGAARASYGARARADRAQRRLTSVERAAPLTAARVCARARVASVRGGKKRKKRIFYEIFNTLVPHRVSPRPARGPGAGPLQQRQAMPAPRRNHAATPMRSIVLIHTRCDLMKPRTNSLASSGSCRAARSASGRATRAAAQRGAGRTPPTRRCAWRGRP